MPSNKKRDILPKPEPPDILEEILDKVITGPMTGEDIEALMKNFKKALH